MSDISDYLENAIMNWMRGTTFPSAPANAYVALFSSAPTDTGSAGVEVTTTIRVAGRVAAGFGAISGGLIANASTVSFGAAAGGATISHVALFDASSAGNMLAHRALAAPTVVAGGSTVQFNAGSITFTVA